MPVVSFSIESELLKKFELLLKREGFKGKSEAFRAAIHDFVLKYQLPEIDEDVNVEMIIGFSYIDSNKIRNNLSRIQHEYGSFMKETLHRHVFNNVCFELLIVQGIKNELQPLLNAIRSTRGIESFYATSYADTNDNK